MVVLKYNKATGVNSLEITTDQLGEILFCLSEVSINEDITNRGREAAKKLHAEIHAASANVVIE